ncbi:hypothetical protein SAMN05421811_1303 [Nonomuraea wenchangensis]|uniref:Uncharacterized protein n=1 Tax=Nonomuraea wenchangensis TaxID=568860 RepID=A0A1I0LV03_9ACTN|nr:hypothetical protein SAMN05421811_1303 [Nonomuraea wenchangensis]
MGRLVRDRVPDIIRQSGREPVIAVLDDIDYRKALLTKLFEEADELREASLAEVAEEMIGRLRA